MAVKLKKGLPKIVTANDLKNGLAVFLKSDGSWSLSINEAAIVVADEEIEALLSKGVASENDNVVIGPYLVDIEQDGSNITPIHMREAMRARGGPSVREDLWKQTAV